MMKATTAAANAYIELLQNQLTDRPSHNRLRRPQFRRSLNSARSAYSAANAARRHAGRVGHAARPSADPRHSTSPSQSWPRRMHTSGEPVSTIAATLGVSRATVYRVLSETEGQS
jgi:DNA invertase Pin-like site-specific DNA recombinase